MLYKFGKFKHNKFIYDFADKPTYSSFIFQGEYGELGRIGDYDNYLSGESGPDNF